jgi:SH3-like domain-containing protein
MTVRRGKASGLGLALALLLAQGAAADAVGPEGPGADNRVEAPGQARPNVDTEAEVRGPVTNLPLPRYVSLRAERANARRGPSVSHRVDWEFTRRGWPLRVTAEYGHWRRVEDMEGAGGWVHHSLLSGARTAVFVGADLVPLHVTQSEASAVRAYAEPGVVAQLQRCGDGWCEVSVGGAAGWVRQARLWGTN